MEVAGLILEFLRVLIWPTALLIVIFWFRQPLFIILDRLKVADLPGGISLNFDQEIRKAQELSREVTAASEKSKDKRASPSIPLTEANERLMSLGMQPSPSGLDMSFYRTLAQQDPNIAMAGLRLEVEILARNLAKGFDVTIDSHDSADSIIRKLYDHNAITIEQLQLVQKMLHLFNAAAHGYRVSLDEAESIIDIAKALANQYVAWLSWGFEDGWKSSTTS
jgi:hypothetical protein